ncbi:MAG TPA: haloalkane dehalogenase [Solimonas sp.]|nr:haloalkane dehalogenase [Solimonas sp.]
MPQASTPDAVLRTPEARFDALAGFPWTPHYVEDLAGFDGLRMHYVDEGPRDARHTWLCLHGNPTWGYLYRKMIPLFLAAGGRVVAPDLFGFGRSDKPLGISHYSFDFHRNALLALIGRLDLQRITLVCQDWGGLLGLTLPMEQPQRFRRLLVMNTMLATGEAPLSEGFKAWRAWCASQPDLAVGRLLRRSHPALTQAEMDAYDAPFPDARYKAGIRAFPDLVCDGPDAPGAETSRRARDWWRSQWRGRSFMAIGLRDPVFGEPVMRALREDIPGCPEPLCLEDAGHFTQEQGERIARAALASFKN